MMHKLANGGWFVRTLLALAMLLETACITRPSAPSEPLVPRGAAGPVALVVSERAPLLALAPAIASKPEGAAKGAGKTALGIVGACVLLAPVAKGYALAVVAVTCVGMLIFAPVTVAVLGASETRPEHETSEAQRLITEAAHASAPSSTLRSALTAAAGLHPEHAARVLAGEVSLPTTADREALAARGFRSVVVLDVNELTLVGGGFDPPMTLLVTVRARQYSLPGGDLVAEGMYRAEGKPRKYSVWAASDAAALRGELTRTLRDIAEQILDSMPTTVNPQAPLR